MAGQNPYAQYAQPANPYLVYSTPGTGPKPATGFRANVDGSQSYIPGSNEDPAIKARQAAAEAQARAAASTPIEVGGQIQAASARTAMELSAAKAKMDYENALKDQDRAKGPTMTAAERTAALAGYKTAQQLDTLIGDVEARYKEGPGKTSGLAGLRDYNSFSTVNQRFDSAGNAVRGLVGSALGFTGGQLNTPGEAEAAVGPYVPHANDRDEVILDKIARLRQLRDNARDRSVAQLGGVPDQQGRIIPIAPTSAATPGAPPAPNATNAPTAPQAGPGAPQMSIATGAVRSETDKQGSAIIDAMIRSGASDDQIDAALTAVGSNKIDRGQSAAARAYLAKHQNYKGSFGGATRAVQQTALNRLSASPVGSFGIGAANGLMAGGLDEVVGAANSALTGQPMSEAIAQADRAKQASAETNPIASFAGNMLGGTAGMLAGGAAAGSLGLTGALGRAAPMAGDIAFGAASGAGENNDNRLLGAGVGAGASLAGRGLVAGGTRMFGRSLRGVQNADVRALADQGVPLTVGQTLSGSGALGAGVKGVEDRLTGIPLLGDVVRERRLEGIRGFNRTAFDQGLAPIGATTNGVTGEAGIDLARGARSRAYSGTLDPVRLSPDSQFAQDIATAEAGAGRLPADMSARAQYAIERAGENVDQGMLTGSGFQQSLRRFRRTTNENAPLPNGHDLGEVMGQAENAYTGLVGRQAPEVLPALNAANAANRNVEVLRDAVNRGRNGTRVGEPGLFAPSQLNDAAAANARRFGNSQGTTDQPFFNLTRAGQNVLPSSVPDSGTAGRLATLALPAALGGVGGAGGYASGDTETGTKAGLGIGALLALGGTKAGQRTLTKLLVERPDLLKQLGDYTADQLPKRIGMFGRSAGTAALLPMTR